MTTAGGPRPPQPPPFNRVPPRRYPPRATAQAFLKKKTEGRPYRSPIPEGQKPPLP